jgi:hypothetical protein
VRYRLAAAGSDRALFPDDALGALHELSLGALREIDRLATAALREAVRRKKKLVDRELVTRVAESIARFDWSYATPQAAFHDAAWGPIVLASRSRAMRCASWMRRGRAKTMTIDQAAHKDINQPARAHRWSAPDGVRVPMALLVHNIKQVIAGRAAQAPTCGGRMKLLAMVTEPNIVARYLAKIREPTGVPERSPNRGPPYWYGCSKVLRRQARPQDRRQGRVKQAGTAIASSAPLEIRPRGREGRNTRCQKLADNRGALASQRYGQAAKGGSACRPEVPCGRDAQLEQRFLTDAPNWPHSGNW